MDKILKFLEDLELNNKREWFLQHQEQYQSIRKSVLAIANRLIRSISDFYDLPYDLKASDCIFRINRDTRFSKDKTPYKTNFGIEITRNWKRVWLPCFYLHIQPWNASFIAGGLYMPDSKTTGKIRETINKNWKQLKKVIDQILRPAWPVGRSESFYLYDDAVKTSPRWYKKDNPNIELLKLKHWIMERQVTDKEMLSVDFEKKLIQDFEKMSGFVEWLQNALNS